VFGATDKGLIMKFPNKEFKLNLLGLVLEDKKVWFKKYGNLGFGIYNHKFKDKDENPINPDYESYIPFVGHVIGTKERLSETYINE